MKPGNLIVKIVMWVLFATIVAYFALYTYHVLFQSYETAPLYSYTAEDSVEANGTLFRTETVLEDGSDLEEVVVGEGRKVAVGDTLAIHYDNQEALERSQQLTDLQSRLESLEYILSHASDGSDSATLNQSITEAITDVRVMAANRDFSKLEKTSETLKNLMFRRDYTYNGSSALSEEISDLSSQITQLESQNAAVTTEITADVSGIFSSVVDGYESVLTEEAVTNLTVEKLHALTADRKQVSGDELGKLITSATWYYAAEVAEEDTEQLYEGATVSVRFNGLDREFQMEVESISKPEDGQVCVVFSCDEYLSEVTMLRDQVADILFGSVTGYWVEKSAIYVDSATGNAGVYRLYGSQAMWVDVDLLWEGEDHYLIRQSPQYDEEGNELPLSDLESARQLRAGAEIIVSGTDLYDGKVLQ